MVYKLPFDLSVICRVLGIPYGKFYRWIKGNITSFNTQEVHKRLHQHDIPRPNHHSDILVPILREEQVGESMALDEKHINGRFYTVFSNATTSKVSLLSSTIRINEIKECMVKLGKSLNNVKFITRDLSPTYKNICDTMFPNAIQIADKFHVIRHGIEAVQAIRIRLKQEELKKQREAERAHIQRYKEFKNSEIEGCREKISKTYKPPKLSNGETAPELLSRSKYICVIDKDKWNFYQKKRAEILFKEYPELKNAYYKILEFRQWYKPKPKEYEPFTNERTLGNWLDEMETETSNELLNFRKLVENNFEFILNYHRYAHKTNAIAESINAKIMEVIRKNKGSRDVDFFNYRLEMII